jgi:hypothetical protein
VERVDERVHESEEREREKEMRRERGERIMLNVGGIPDQVQVQPPYSLYPQSFLSSFFFLIFLDIEDVGGLVEECRKDVEGR